MKNPLFIKGLLIILLITFNACSSDDDNVPVCYDTNPVITINGQVQAFQAIGRGIDIRPIGYELSINLDRRHNMPYREQSVSIKLPYKQTGENIIEAFNYSQYIDDISFSGDFLDGEFQSNVITNTNECIYATFSGVLSDGNQEITITNGILKYTYQNPFDE